jgi:hypothetical protein
MKHFGKCSEHFCVFLKSQYGETKHKDYDYNFQPTLTFIDWLDHFSWRIDLSLGKPFLPLLRLNHGLHPMKSVGMYVFSRLLDVVILN